MKQPAPPASRGISLSMTCLCVAAALIVGFAAGWLVRDAREPAPGQAASPAENEQLNKRIAELTVKVAANPKDAESLVQLGHAYFDSGQPGPAVEAYSKYLALRPGDPDVLTDMGVMLRELGQPQQALASFDAALAINPGHEIAHFNKGIVLAGDLGDKASAIAEFEKLLRLNPNAKAPNGAPVSGLVRELRQSLPAAQSAPQAAAPQPGQSAGAAPVPAKAPVPAQAPPVPAQAPAPTVAPAPAAQKAPDKPGMLLGK